MSDSEPKRWELGPESEYRFELDPGTSLAIKVCLSFLFFILKLTLLRAFLLIQLVQGQAEIFGFELAEGKAYLFGFECKAALFTWRGCVIEMSSISSLSPPYPSRDLAVGFS
jgi:polyribonucleotide 5'-hydroxyl-kinase